MPTGPHRFGCGEIATGFKPSGFPPGFFNHPRIVPKPGGGGSTGGGGGGGGSGQFECYTEEFTCETRYPGLNYQGTITEPACREATSPCVVNGTNCFNNSTECEAAILGYGENDPCPRADDCGPTPPYWECVTTQEICPGFWGSQGPFKYTRVCEEVAAGAGSFASEIECQQSPCQSEENCPEPPTSTVGKPTTGQSVVRFSCVTGPVQHCNYPQACLGTGGGACFEPSERYDKTCVQCTNCVETVVNGQIVVNCDPPPAGGGACVHLAGTGCGAGCVSEPPCPVLTTNKHCTTTSITPCWSIYSEQGVSNVSQYPSKCQSRPGACEQTERACKDAVSWTTGGKTCCCVPGLGMVNSCGPCIGEGPGANCVSESCPPLVGDPPTSNPWM